MTQRWSPSTYAQHAAFVPALGAPLVDLLAPVPGERILDLGCGDGTLTERLVAAGATVVAVDASPDMVCAAAGRGLDARVADATALPFDAEFDAVFSNAVLHWVRDHDAMLAGVRRALRPGGRFVAEFGGFGNVAAIHVALGAALMRRGVPYGSPWYYPTVAEYESRLVAAGFVVDRLVTFARPTKLPTGILGWLRTFAGAMLKGVPVAEQPAVLEEVAELLAPALRDGEGNWTADYVRLQLVAHTTV